jgi:hypothetical protein
MDKSTYLPVSARLFGNHPPGSHSVMPLSHTQSHQLQHGYYQIERLGTLLRLTIAEGINRELVLQYQTDVAEHVEALRGQLWGVHLIIAGDVLMTPEAAEALIGITRSHQPLGRCGTAIELRNTSVSGLLKAFWGNIYQASGIPYAFFESSAEAELWLHEQIAIAQANRQNIESL